MSNDHYIPEFLTKPWKQEGFPLWHFNFKDKQFYEKPSIDRIFAKRNLWSNDLEVFLNKHTENFSASARAKLVQLKEQPNTTEFQSLFLLILFQAARTGHMRGLGDDLEKVVSFDMLKLEQLVQAAQKDWSLCGIHLPNKYRLFFPDNGIFLFPVQFHTSFKWIFALPMDACFCLALIPSVLDIEAVSKQIDYSHLVTWSVCSSDYCERVVIHPDLYHYKEKTEDLAKELVHMREAVDLQIASINKLNELNYELSNFLSALFK